MPLKDILNSIFDESYDGDRRAAITAAYDEDMSGADARIQTNSAEAAEALRLANEEKDRAIADANAAKAEVTRIKAVNFDLMRATPSDPANLPDPSPGTTGTVTSMADLAAKYGRPNPAK